MPDACEDRKRGFQHTKEPVLQPGTQVQQDRLQCYSELLSMHANCAPDRTTHPADKTDQRTVFQWKNLHHENERTVTQLVGASKN